MTLINRMHRRSDPQSDANLFTSVLQHTGTKLIQAGRTIAPAVIALSFAAIAHAQGTMDFSGAQTLMGTFKTFAMYAGAVICLGGLIFAGIRMMSGRFHGARTVIVASHLAMIGCLVAIYFIPPPLWHLYVLFALIGLLGVATTPVTYSRVVANWFDRRRGTASVSLLRVSVSGHSS